MTKFLNTVLESESDIELELSQKVTLNNFNFLLIVILF